MTRATQSCRGLTREAWHTSLPPARRFSRSPRTPPVAFDGCSRVKPPGPGRCAVLLLRFHSISTGGRSIRPPPVSRSPGNTPASSSGSTASGGSNGVGPSRARLRSGRQAAGHPASRDHGTGQRNGDPKPSTCSRAATNTASPSICRASEGHASPVSTSVGTGTSSRWTAPRSPARSRRRSSALRGGSLQ